MAGLSRIHVAFEHYGVDREQRALQERFERGERTTDEYLRQWQEAEQWARRFIVGQQMFELVADTLFVETLPLPDYMQTIDAMTRNPKYTPEERLHLQTILRDYLDTK